MDWYAKDITLSNESWKPIRDQILQDEHLILAHALEILESCKVPRWGIKLFRTDAIILSTRPHIAKKAKEALVNLKRDALNVPKGWLTFNGPSLLKGVEGEGEVFRAFDCDCPVQKQSRNSLRTEGT